MKLNHIGWTQVRVAPWAVINTRRSKKREKRRKKLHEEWGIRLARWPSGWWRFSAREMDWITECIAGRSYQARVWKAPAVERAMYRWILHLYGSSMHEAIRTTNMWLGKYEMTGKAGCSHGNGFGAGMTGDCRWTTEMEMMETMEAADCRRQHATKQISKQ